MLFRSKISQGGITSTVVDARIVTKLCIDNLCTGVILCHNHPSGNLEPSEADKQITKKLAKCLSVFDIKIVDHLIITATKSYSFAESSDNSQFLRA